MTDKNDSRNTPYDGERNTEPSPQTGNINARNNNAAASTRGTTPPNVEVPGDAGIGDAAQSKEKLTDYTANHSADA